MITEMFLGSAFRPCRLKNSIMLETFIKCTCYLAEELVDNLFTNLMKMHACSNTAVLYGSHVLGSVAGSLAKVLCIVFNGLRVCFIVL